MTVEELHDEVEAIESIYPDTIKAEAPQIYTIKIPNHSEVSFQLTFPVSYPDAQPEVLQVLNSSKSTFTDESYLEKKISSVLNDIFTSGQVVMFELLTELQEVFDQIAETRAAQQLERESKSNSKSHSPPLPPLPLVVEQKKYDKAAPQSADIDHTAGWQQSEPIIDRHSTFIAYVRQVHSVKEAQMYLDNLVLDRRISKATHNISSWRIKDKDGLAVYQDCDDDGEMAAGSRLLHLLQMMDVWNVIVVVSRWFGGIHLGPDRFKHINSAARDALTKGCFSGLAPTKSKKK
ncbi:uncharacterized protein LODBEIA_P05630 [Lodderomyces beijingensis]|uniref:RWD domain-containing protein n=1 Tax=Lodderomyces beijingensis TaxID=1775926 RepID=A0ABP0ZDU0_9ASCO